MRTSTVAGVRIDYPNSVAFMYSRQPVIVTFPGGAAGVTSVGVKLTCPLTGRTHTESRAPYSSSIEFDISRIMQLLATDVDHITKRFEDEEGTSLSEQFELAVSYTQGQTTTQLLTAEIVGMYGALDQGEIYGEHTQRRLWLNFPQTFNLWRDPEGSVQFVTDEAYISPNAPQDAPCCECSLMETLRAVEESGLIDSLKHGAPLRNLGLSWRPRIEDGNETTQTLRTITLIPDCARRTDGTYLRWLNRRGEMSYWLFTESKLRVTTSVADTFVRYYQGDPTIPERGIFQNPQKASYREAREMVLGAVGLSRDEFDDLCDLATSPLVERLMPGVLPEDTALDTVYDGGDATTQDPDTLIESAAGLDTEVEGGDAGTGKSAQSDRWQRVNVVAGTFERDIRRKTPNRQDLEIIIELPERNTIKL